MSNKFNEGIEPAYVDLPVPVNYLYWKRGNAQLAHLKDEDPGAYFGGWSASVHGKEEDYPALPLPIVTRTADNGQDTYERYATNILNFLPIASRMRYELLKAGEDGKEKVVSVSKQYISGVHTGYKPHKQVFGIVYSADMSETGYAILKLNKWSSFLSFSKAAQAWSKIKVGENQALVRQYGSIGVKGAKGKVSPNFETFNEGKSTPIEAVNLDTPIFVDVDEELNTLWEQAQEWSKCPRWNASGQVVDPVEGNTLPPMPDDIPFE